MTSEQELRPDYVFETSWEVCNKVGGIYTVLASRSQTLLEVFGDHLIFIGPDLWQGKANEDFREDRRLLKAWREAARKEGIGVRIGRWTGATGSPVAVLVDFTPFFEQKNAIYAQAWEDFGVDSIKAYGDYDEASMFSYAAARFVEALYKYCCKGNRIVYQAHEWMSGLGMLYLSKALPDIATVFTTHATSIGRSIAGNGKQLYKYFHGYDGDQMAGELHMEAKHSVEKQSALHADCFTTVSTFTDRECTQLLGKAADVVLPNGFDSRILPAGAAFTRQRRMARANLLRTASALLGEQLTDQTLIVSTSGRNDYRCKGFDVYLEALAQLSAKLRGRNETGTRVLALVEVPCWTREPRADLLSRLASGESGGPLPHPFLTHELNDFGTDRLVNTIRGLALWNTPDDPVKVMLIPCYLDGNDGILDLDYYAALTANDLCIYPSYYEPWGYTPLEACAFHTPCITTDLSGFGQWATATAGHQPSLATDGVAVLHRDDDNYFDVARQIADITLGLLDTGTPQRTVMRRKAAQFAAKAEWKCFIGQYYKAYQYALQHKQK